MARGRVVNTTTRAETIRFLKLFGSSYSKLSETLPNDQQTLSRYIKSFSRDIEPPRSLQNRQKVPDWELVPIFECDPKSHLEAVLEGLWGSGIPGVELYVSIECSLTIWSSFRDFEKIFQKSNCCVFARRLQLR